MPGTLHSRLLENLATFLEDDQPYLLHLLGADITVAWDTPSDDLVADEADFDGYAPITLAAAVAEIRSGKEQWQISWPEKTFTAGGAAVPTYIYGLWIATDEMTPRVLKVDKFTAPILLDAPGAELRHTPVIVIGNDIDTVALPPPPPGDEIYCEHFTVGVGDLSDTGDAGTSTVAGGVCTMTVDGNDTDADYAELSYAIASLPDNWIVAVNVKIDAHTGDDGSYVYFGGNGPAGQVYIYGVLSETSAEITFWTYVGGDVERVTIPVPAGWFQMSIEFDDAGQNLIFNVHDGDDYLGPWIVFIGTSPTLPTAWFGCDATSTTDTLEAQWDDFCLHDLDA